MRVDGLSELQDANRKGATSESWGYGTNKNALETSTLREMPYMLAETDLRHEVCFNQNSSAKISKSRDQAHVARAKLKTWNIT